MTTVICQSCCQVTFIPCCDQRTVVYGICESCLAKQPLTGAEICHQCAQNTFQNLMAAKVAIIRYGSINAVPSIARSGNPMIAERNHGVNCEIKMPMANLHRSNSQNHVYNQVSSLQPTGMREIPMSKVSNNLTGPSHQHPSKYASNQIQELTEEDIRMSNEVLSMPLNCEPRLIKEREKIGRAEFSLLRNPSPPPEFQDWQPNCQSYNSSMFCNKSNTSSMYSESNY